MGLTVVSAVPGWATREPLVRQFGRVALEGGTSYVTSFLEAALPPLHECVQQWDLDRETGIEVASMGEILGKLRRLVPSEHGPEAPASWLRRLIVARLATSEPPFSHLARSSSAPRQILETLCELGEAGWTPDDLRAAAPSQLGVFSRWLTFLADTEDALTLAAHQRGRSRNPCGHPALFTDAAELDGIARLLVFTESLYRPTWVRLLKWLAERGVEVTVVTERHAADAGLFPVSRRIEETLGVPPRLIGAGHALATTLFADETARPEFPVEERYALDGPSEAEWALRVASGGETAIWCRDLDALGDDLAEASRRLEVPARMCRRVALASSGLAADLATLLSALADHPDGWERVVETNALSMSAAGRRAAKRVLTEHVAPGETFDPRVLLTALHVDEPAATRLRAALEWRADTEPAPAPIWIQRVQTLGSETIVPTSAELPAFEYRREDQAASRVLMELTDGLSVAPPDEPLTLDTVAQVIARSVRDGKYHVPSGDVGVCVAAHPAALPPTRTLIAMNMVEGAAPRSRREDPWLPDFLRHALNARRGERPPLLTAADRAAEEPDHFYRAVCFARDRLVMTRAARNGESATLPSPYLAAVLGESREALAARPTLPLIPGPDHPEAQPFDHALRGRLDAPTVPIPEPATVTEEGDALVRHDAPITIAEFLDAAVCPLMYALRHRVPVRPRWGARTEVNATRLAHEMATWPTADADTLYANARDRLSERAPRRDPWRRHVYDAHADRVARTLTHHESLMRDKWRLPPAETPTLEAEGLRHDLAGLTFTGDYFPVHRLSESPHEVWAVRLPFAARELDERFRSEEGLLTRLRVYLAAGLGYSATRRLVFLGTQGENGPVLTAFGRRLPGYLANAPLNASVFHALDDRDETDDPGLALNAFVRAMKPEVARAREVILNGDARPRPGIGCATCEMGEICRRHLGYSELEEVDLFSP